MKSKIIRYLLLIFLLALYGGAGCVQENSGAGASSGISSVSKSVPRHPPCDPVLFKSFKINNRIDEIVLDKLKENGVPPSETCTDAVFIRRVYLDTTGTLPSAETVRSFLSGTDPQKRRILIDKLLAQDEFADYWAMKWGDMLRIKAEFPSNLWPQAAQAYYRWVRESIRTNMPYDKFVRKLLCSSGSNFHMAPVNFYRAFQDRHPRQIAENVSLLFMGVRLNEQNYSEQQIMGMAAFFAKVAYKNTDEWKEEIVYFNPDAKMPDPKPAVPAAKAGELKASDAAKSGAQTAPIPPPPPLKPSTLDGKSFDIPAESDPRLVFTDWLTAPGNPWFAKNICNRIWFWLLGRGIIHEADDIRSSNPPWSPELLAFLEEELVKNKYNMRHVYRLILNSNTYQLSSKTMSLNSSDADGFSHYRIRRLDAEPLVDIICQVTSSSEKYSSNIPEPFTFLPDGIRAVAIADGSISSPFLELFGRPSRNTSYESERISVPSPLQSQHMLNSSHIQKKIQQCKFFQQLLADKKDNLKIIEELYLRILSRFPAESEKATAAAYLASPKRKPIESIHDVAWALINTKEFILKH